jgi:hypothetical protein
MRFSVHTTGRRGRNRSTLAKAAVQSTKSNIATAAATFGEQMPSRGAELVHIWNRCHNCGAAPIVGLCFACKRVLQRRTMTFARLVIVCSSKAESYIPRRKPARRQPAAMYFARSKVRSVNTFCLGSLFPGPQRLRSRFLTASWFDRSSAAGTNHSSEAMALLLRKTVRTR